MSSDRWLKILWAVPLINIVYGVINIFQLGVFLPLIPFEDLLIAMLFLLVGVAVLQKTKSLNWIILFAWILSLLHFLKSYVLWESITAFEWYEKMVPYFIVFLLIFLIAYWLNITPKKSYARIIGLLLLLSHFVFSVLLDFSYHHAINYCLLSAILIALNWGKQKRLETMVLLFVAAVFLINKIAYIWI